MSQTNSLEHLHGSRYDAAEDIAGMKIVFVNVFFVGNQEKWFLVDAGLQGFGGKIKAFAEDKFGVGKPPEFILLTHGHFDHIGALESLLKEWDVPVYAHNLELPYLQGKSNYPPPDPAIGGGTMAYMSWIFPIKPINLKERVQALPDHGTLPGFPEWQIIYTPGHSPGHISLFREADRVLITGDAFVTVNQNSASAVLTQKKELHGPPAYFTCDWKAAKESVKKLNELKPLVAACGHGIPMKGEDLRKSLNKLASQFDENAIPSRNGRYVKKAAKTDETGIVEMPTPISFRVARSIAFIGLAAVATFSIIKLLNGKKSEE